MTELPAGELPPQQPWRRFVATGLIAMAAGCLALLLAQVVQSARDAAQLKAYAATVLTRAEHVATSSVQALDSAAALGTAPCSAEELAALRLLSFNTRYIRDTARLHEGKVVCSASWGHLNPPRVMPPPDRRVRGYQLWRSVSNVFSPAVAVDMTSKGDFIVSTAPMAFDAVARPPIGMAVQVASRKGDHVFQQFGAFEKDRGRVSTLASVFTHNVAPVCSTRFDFCVSARHIGPGLLIQSGLASVIWALGALAGGSLAFAANERRRRRDGLAHRFGQALKRDDLYLVYQPLRRFSDGRLVGFEALARWTVKGMGEVRPDQFVPLAERHGLGTAMASTLLDRLLRDCGPTLRRLPALYVSLNVSAADLTDDGFCQRLAARVAETGIGPSNLVLELTERSTASHGKMALNMKALRAQGFRFYIDDFGTGYSNFAYLAELPVEAIKMDRRFTQAIGTDSPMSHIVRSIVDLAQTLDLALVVEGVEHQAQADYMLDIAPASIGQGWLLGRPQRDFAAMIERERANYQGGALPVGTLPTR